MSERSVSLFALPESESSGICKRLGVVLGNASMYGMAHTVTATAQAAAYDSLVSLLDLYGDLEWGMSSDGLLLNGKPVDSRGTIQTLVDQMNRSNVQNFAFCPPLDRQEFCLFLSVLSAEPGSPIIVDGVDAALVKAGFKSIRVDKAVYARVGSKGAGGGREMTASTDSRQRTGSARPRRDEPTKGKVFDLDSELLGLDNGGGEEESPLFGGGGLDMATVSQTSHYIEQRNEIRKQHEAMVKLLQDNAGDKERLEQIRREMLDAGFPEQDWNVLLRESGIGSSRPLAPSSEASLDSLLNRVGELTAQRESAGGGVEDMRHALEAISHEVDNLILHAQGQTETLAQRVDSDRETVAEIERQARDRGVGLKLSRDELLTSLAEINQELVQPLTTSSALLQLLRSGKSGAVTDAQRELLDTAAEGMERLEKLVHYLQRISGFPVELSPDHGLLSEVYRDR